jgi:hypothetical protein
MSWLFWLLPPLVAGALVSVWAWWPDRPRRRRDSISTVRAHGRFLDTLAGPPAGRTRAPAGD